MSPEPTSLRLRITLHCCRGLLDLLPYDPHTGRKNPRFDPENADPHLDIYLSIARGDDCFFGHRDTRAMFQRMPFLATPYCVFCGAAFAFPYPESRLIH